MAQKADPSVFSPEDLADESLFDDEEPLTRPGTSERPSAARPRVVAPRPEPRAEAKRPRRVMNDADAEALAIANKVVQKVAVARSLFRIASSVVRSYADQKMTEIVEQDAGNVMAHVARAQHVAMAAKEAAKHAASLAAARAAAKAQEAAQTIEQTTNALFDHEEAHDDAC